MSNDSSKKGAGKNGKNEILFSVDAALLKELGERLVGKAHIALAELVKNSYDADATKVEIEFTDDGIEIRDNGHGMTFDEFEGFWMRVGSPHKQKLLRSPRLDRSITGSKGVGRLAVQFLADEIELVTASEENDGFEIVADVDWRQAVKAVDLTKAKALWARRKRQTVFPENSDHGTIIVLRGRHQEWSAEDLQDLAREIWVLQPPFKRGALKTAEGEDASFYVELETSDKVAATQFQIQMAQGLNQWIAKISGRIRREGTGDSGSAVDIVVEFANGTKSRYTHELKTSFVFEADFEIRVFRLTGKQKGGILVQDAREYISEFGGVHVYDAGFHLPYYGPDEDWLGLERDHAARLTRSQLLPEGLQVERGLQFLPTQRRIFGVVNINTAKERSSAIERQLLVKSKNLKVTNASRVSAQIKADEFLKIQVTRDRLVDNGAFQELRDAVRAAIDFYSVETQRRNQRSKSASDKIVPLNERFEKIADVLAYYKDEIPSDVFADLDRELKAAAKQSEGEAEVLLRRARLLGSLATAGISALAHQHEVDKQLNAIEEISRSLSRFRTTDLEAKRKATELHERLTQWLERSRATRNLFVFMMDEDNRTIKDRFRAKILIQQVVSQIGVLLRGINVDTSDVSPDLRLPQGTFAEWSSIFQNILLNAVAAMIETLGTEISISSRTVGHKRRILVQDEGVGVDVRKSEALFEPFVRKLELSPENRSLGLGGTGLGLTIVRMLATQLDCKVAFVDPDEDFSTAFQIEWEEAK